jgi:hypothetical protein
MSSLALGGVVGVVPGTGSGVVPVGAVEAGWLVVVEPRLWAEAWLLPASDNPARQAVPNKADSHLFISLLPPSRFF